MSENVLSYGFMSVLATPVGNSSTDEWQKFQESLEETGLSLNYEGTILFSQKNAPRSAGIILTNHDLYQKFQQECQKAGVAVLETSTQFYVCRWYNGSDSDMSDLLLEEFCDETGFNSNKEPT
jgi:hypothetical protein